MKKTYLARRNALLSAKGVSWGMGALIFSLVVLCVRLVAPNLFWQAFSPVFFVSNTISSASQSFFAHFSDAAELSVLNDKLSAENAALATQSQELSQKMMALEALLGGREARPAGILAGVVARPPTSPYDTLVLGSGAKDGVVRGMEAFGPGGVPVGVVSAVLDDFSRVTLFSTPGTLTNGWVGRASVPLSLVGAGAGALHATVARAAGIAVGDVVFVPGPGQLPMGSVVRMDSDPLSPSVTLRIASALNPFSLSWIELRATGITGVSFATSTPL